MGGSKLLLTEKDAEYGRALAGAVSVLHSEFEVTIRSLDIGETDCGEKQGFVYENGKTGSEVNVQEFDLILAGGYPEKLLRKFGEAHGCEKRIVILAETMAEELVKQSQNTENCFWHIYKYQNIVNIVSGLNFIIGTTTGKRNLLRKNSTAELIGFYSAGGGTGKTVITLGTLRELSRYHDKKVLYLSFEDIPATELFIRNSSESRGIGDYLYYLLERKDEKLCRRLDGFVSSDESGVETFYPSCGRNDLNLLTQEELIRFFRIISDSARYDYIALDMKSDLTEATLFLMKLCERIVLTQDDNPVSRFKNRKLISYLGQLNSFCPSGRFIVVTNRSECWGAGEPERNLEPGDGGDLWSETVKRISIEKDEGGFRYRANCMDIDIGHAFGIGVKKIADEILATETDRKTGEYREVPEPEKKTY